MIKLAAPSAHSNAKSGSSAVKERADAPNIAFLGRPGHDQVIKEALSTLLWLDQRAEISVDNHRKLTDEVSTMLTESGVQVPALTDRFEPSAAIRVALESLPLGDEAIAIARTVRMAILRSPLTDQSTL